MKNGFIKSIVILILQLFIFLVLVGGLYLALMAM